MSRCSFPTRRSSDLVPHFGGGEIQRGDRGTAGRVAKLRVATEVSHEDDFIDASHNALLRAPTFAAARLVRLPLRGPGARTPAVTVAVAALTAAPRAPPRRHGQAA